jgi:hypothetical protein
MGKVYEQVRMFKAKYPHTITWFRLRKHAAVVEKHLNPDEEPIYTFAGQKDGNPLSIFNTCVVCLTNKRIIIGQDSIVVDYTLNSITPELFNDMQVYSGVLFGKVTIDTIKETIEISNLDKRSLAEIESSVTSFMLAEKKKFAHYR